MYREYKDRVEFSVVYIEEAHASDLWQMDSNVRDKVVFASPRNMEERDGLASSCVRKLGLEIPAVVDGMAGPAVPDRTRWQGAVQERARPIRVQAGGIAEGDWRSDLNLKGDTPV